MNALRSLRAIVLGPPLDYEMDGSTPSALEQAGVPVSLADCRNCPNPCEEGHEEYPEKISSMIDNTSDMLGSVKPYRRQVVISTGKSDWARSVTDEKGSLAHHLQAVDASAPSALATLPISLSSTTLNTPSTTPGTTAPSTPDKSLKDLDASSVVSSISGIFRDNETTKVSILNGSHDTLSHDHTLETVLVFPDYKVIAEVPRSLKGARELWEHSVDPSVSRLGSSSSLLPEGNELKSWVIPYSCVILICSHRRRDVRCAVVAPKLEHAFSDSLHRQKWEVHTQLDYLEGPPLEDFDDSEDDKQAEMLRRLQELENPKSTHETAHGHPKRALILKTSHIGGHKYAGNVIIYMPQGAGVWYGRVSTHEVEPIVRNTILGGKILPPLLRGGVNLSRPDCKRLNDW